MNTPEVSILMAVHNGEKTVGAALESMLAQTFCDFELVIVNDGSTDGTAGILSGVEDPRMRIVANGENLGLPPSLNRGWEICRGKYVARMDADDLSLPNRLAVQAAFLDEHPEIAAVGSFVEAFSDGLPGTLVRYPTDSCALAATLLFRSALAHPAVMLRKGAIDGAGLRFEAEFRYAQDYALWLACVEKGLPLANIGEVLLRYRVHEGQLSHAMDHMQAEGTVIRTRFLRQWMSSAPPTDADLALHDAIARDQFCAEYRWLEQAASWLEKLALHNDNRPRFAREAFLRALTGRYVALARFADGHEIDRPRADATWFAPYLHKDALPTPTH